MGIRSYLTDGLANVITGLGTRADVRTSRSYVAGITTPQQVEAAYLGSSVLRKVVDAPALDMVREWRDWQAEADEITAIEAEEKRLGLRAKVRQAEIMRALGGAALVLVTPGDLALPINARGAVGSLKAVHLFSRHQLSYARLVDDPADPLFGGPDMWRVNSTTGEHRVHPSRVVCFRGDALPFAMQGSRDAFWGEPRAAAYIDAAMNLDEALSSFAALIKDARNIDIGVPELFERLMRPSSAGSLSGEDAIKNRIGMMMSGTSLFNAVLFDRGGEEGKGGETIERHQVTWAGIPEVIRVYAEALAAASDTPMTRLWGTSPSGLNSSGDSQQKDWNKLVRARQELDLRGCLDQVDAALIPSALGSRPDTVWWQFAPLDVPGEKERADTFKTTMEAVGLVRDSAAIPDVAFNKGVQNLLSEGGYMPGLEGALAELDEATRFGVVGEMGTGDPSALTGGDVVPFRRVANDAADEGISLSGEPPDATE